jgi:hypothetical protein
VVILVLLHVRNRFFNVVHGKNNYTVVLHEQKHFHGFRRRVSRNTEMRKQRFELN